MFDLILSNKVYGTMLNNLPFNESQHFLFKQKIHFRGTFLNYNLAKMGTNHKGLQVNNQNGFES